MKTETLNYIVKALANTASHDPTRYNLGFCYVEKIGDNKVKLEACDGHVLSRVTVEDDLFCESVRDNNTCIGTEELATLKAIEKKWRKIGGVPAEEYSRLFKTYPKEQKPNLDAVQPLITSHYVDVYFNPDLLKAVHSALMGKGEPGIKLRIPVKQMEEGEMVFEQSLKPFLHESRDGTRIGVIMPMRM